ncbi:MAG: hypothetical protein ACOVR6_10175 [Fimbriimonas sp.]|jgi:hypothetical protein|nr:hypothetical protein [Fimbriimonadaceae bacterium]MCE2768286.1 hypothetical protein [Fimbriimonadaceae bacterium]
MKFVLITKDQDMVKEAREGFHPGDEFLHFENWEEALNNSEGVDLLFVDLLATLQEEGKIAGYEEFAHAKMGHPVANATPLVLISPPDDYELDFMAGWPDFVFANVRRPITYKIFRRASTWV